MKMSSWEEKQLKLVLITWLIDLRCCLAFRVVHRLRTKWQQQKNLIWTCSWSEHIQKYWHYLFLFALRMFLQYKPKPCLLLLCIFWKNPACIACSERVAFTPILCDICEETRPHTAAVFWQQQKWNQAKQTHHILFNRINIYAHVLSKQRTIKIFGKHFLTELHCNLHRCYKQSLLCLARCDLS